MTTSVLLGLRGLCPGYMLLRLVVIGCCLIAGILPNAEGATQSSDRAAQLDRLIRDACSREVVLLGEDSAHGSGATLDIKAELLVKLVGRCGFSAVAFESPIYDFLALEHAFVNGSATPAQLSDAIGGIWSTTREIEPVVRYLFQRATAGQVRLLGLDVQVGGATQVYTQSLLPRELTEYLAGERRADCAAQLDRLTNYRFDAATPYDDSARAGLRACVAEIQARIGKKPDAANSSFARMALGISRYLDMAAAGGFNVRDRAMYDNLAWHRSRLPKGTKLIVWCATIHAIKRAPPGRNDRSPMGLRIHQTLGEGAFVIGFSALSGSYGRAHTPTASLSAPPKGSLEALSLQGSPLELRYLDRRQLHNLGQLAARSISYERFISARWDMLLDGLIVLREEHPPDYVRDAKPLQSVPR